MREYSFNLEVAKKYGVDEAILIHSLAFWVKKNRANNKNHHEGRWWTYNTLAALGKLFPFWSKRQLERITASCKASGALFSGNYSTNRQDRTVWYALCDEILLIYGNEDCASDEWQNSISPNGEMDVKAFPQMGANISPNGEIIISNSSLRKLTPIAPEFVIAKFAEFATGNPALLEALMGFAEKRSKMRNPIDTERCANILLNKLAKQSSGDDAVMVEMLDEATLKGWSSVYPPKDGPAQTPKPAASEVVPEW